MKRIAMIPLVMVVMTLTLSAATGARQNFSGPMVVVAVDTLPERAIFKDLNTGRVVQVFYNRRDMRAYNIRTREPLLFYVNTNSGDTLYGRGELIVNGYLMRGPDGHYGWDPAKVEVNGDEIKIKDGDKKVVIEDDKMKIKDENGKLKAKIKG